MARGKQDPPEQPADPPEGAAGARDGEPDENELAKRRAAREEESRTGGSVAERVANGEAEDEDELFPYGSVEGDSAVTLKNLIKSKARITPKASLSKAEVPLTGGFLDPEKEVELLVRCLPGGISPRPTHASAKAGEDHTIDAWTLTQDLRAVHVQGAGEMFTREQVLNILDEAGVPSATVTKVLGETPAAAAGA